MTMQLHLQGSAAASSSISLDLDWLHLTMKPLMVQFHTMLTMI